MKIKTQILFLAILCHLQFCKAQKAQSTSTLPKVENHLSGELDYTYEALSLVQRLADGKEVNSGKINTDGTIDFNLPEYDIKALYDSINLEHVKFQNWFSIDSGCTDRDIFAETPFDDVYAQKTKAIWIEKYGIKVAILEAASDKVKVPNHDATKDSLAVLNTYFWFYMDRAITYKDECSKVSPSSNETYETVNADLAFERGWNFIEENTKWDMDYDQSDPNSVQLKKIYFTKSTPASNKVKWTLRQVADNAKIELAKKLYNVISITQEQFEKWAPNKLGNLSVTTKEYGNPPKGRQNKNNIHLTYSKETDKKVIDLYVVDYSKNPDDIEMIDYVYARENDGKDEKDVKPYVAQFSEREKATKLFYKFGRSMFIEASGTNINAEELWGYIKKMKVEKLQKE